MPQSLSSLIKSKARKQNNTPSAHKAKLDIRERVMEAVGLPRAFVLDAFAGDGAMFRGVWCRARHYVGCDLRFYREGPIAYVADNRRVLRAIDLDLFTVFDLDAYGSPWEQVYIIASRRRVRTGERVGLIITEGSLMGMKLGQISTALCKLAGIRPDTPGVGRAQDEIIMRALTKAADMMGARITRRWQANGSTRSQMRYIGVILEPKAQKGEE